MDDLCDAVVLLVDVFLCARQKMTHVPERVDFEFTVSGRILFHLLFRPVYVSCEKTDKSAVQGINRLNSKSKSFAALRRLCRIQTRKTSFVAQRK